MINKNLIISQIQQQITTGYFSLKNIYSIGFLNPKDFRGRLFSVLFSMLTCLSEFSVKYKHYLG